MGVDQIHENSPPYKAKQHVDPYEDEMDQLTPPVPDEEFWKFIERIYF